MKAKIATIITFSLVFVLLLIVSFPFIKTVTPLDVAHASYQLGKNAAVCDGHSSYAVNESGQYGLSEQSSNVTTELPYFAKQYFRSLKNHGKNLRGSCAYIAVGMWLSFYDTYWNDNIIPEQYDKTELAIRYNNSYYCPNAPGILDEAPNDYLYPNSSDSVYLEYMNSNIGTNFHSYLLDLGMTLGYIDLTDIHSFGLTNDDAYNLLVSYLQNNNNIPQNSFFLHYESHINQFKDTYPNESYTYSEKMRREIIDYVNQGVPVITFINGKTRRDPSSEWKEAYHAVVASDYDNDNDTLYANYGWDSEVNHANIFYKSNTMDYQYITGYIAGSFQLIRHSHSNNYYLSDGSTVCSCKLATHRHTYTYSSKGLNSHTKSCYCDYSEIQSHRFIVDPSQRFYQCIDCGFRKPYDGGSTPYPYAYTIIE